MAIKGYNDLAIVMCNNNTFQNLKKIFIKIHLTANTNSIAMRFYLKQL